MNQERNIFVYGLFDPETDELRYVGKTSVGVARVNQHFRKSNLNKPYHSCRWIKQLSDLGLKPHWTILTYCNSDEEVRAEEIRLIAYYRDQGFCLTNLTEGGDGPIGHKHTDEWKLAASERLKGNKNSLGHKHTPESKAKLSKSLTGKKRSVEQRQRYSESKKGTQPCLGRVLSEETKEKIANSLKGRKYSAERVAAMKAGRLKKGHY